MVVLITNDGLPVERFSRRVIFFTHLAKALYTPGPSGAYTSNRLQAARSKDKTRRGPHVVTAYLIYRTGFRPSLGEKRYASLRDDVDTPHEIAVDDGRTWAALLRSTQC